MWSVRGHRAEDCREDHEDRAARQRDEREALDELRGDRPTEHVDETPKRGDLLQGRDRLIRRIWYRTCVL
jgi:hypothetical protein